jgi:hypothetical protein
MRAASILGLAFLLSAPSFGSPAASKLRNQAPKVMLGLNDVSILLPYNTRPELFTTAPRIDATPDPETFAKGLPAAPVDGSAFVPEDILRSIDKVLADDSENQDELSVFFRVAPQKMFEYRLAAIRFDPCANVLSIKGDETKCRHEFRLVWQHAKRNRFEDNNIHAIYQMNDIQFAEIVATLRELKASAKVDSLGEALQPNPTIAAEGLDSAYYRGVIGLVHRYIRASNLIDIAFLAETSQGGHWPMLKLGVKDKVASTLPLVATDSPELKVQRMDSRGRLDLPFPLGTTKDAIFNVEDPQTLFANAVRLQNPRLHDVDNLDCASCHRSELIKQDLGDLSSFVSPEGAYVNKNWNLKALFGIADQESLQMFSFFFGSVKIAPRVINESAEVADYINSRY